MRAADTSAVVAAFASWHEHHAAARRAIDSSVRLVEHCALETYSVLTRLPPPHRAPAVVVRDFLQVTFPGSLLRMTPQAYRRFVLGLPEVGVFGGAAYDALVAATAAAHDAELVTCDQRALPLYQKYALRVELLS